MIAGGTDLVLEGRTSNDERTLILRMLGVMWPEGLVQEDEASSDAAFPLLACPSALSSEFFVYRDANSLESWTQHGATPENAEDMIHVIFEDDAITFVIATTKEAGRIISDLVITIGNHRQTVSQ